jgi:ATP phosphoribosyltransferase regulatory subunit
VRAGGGGDLVAAAGAPVGARAPREVVARLDRLAVEAETPPLSRAEVDGLEAVLAVAGPSPDALARLEELARDLSGLAPAVDRLSARLGAFAARGIDPSALRFEASFGRTTREYSDGFVFGAVVSGRPDLPPVASGGRYDALTRALGAERPLPAVGGTVRPELLAALAAGDVP